MIDYEKAFLFWFKLQQIMSQKMPDNANDDFPKNCHAQ